MGQRTRKVLEAVLFAAIILLSAVIFLMRDRLENVGEVGYLGLFFLCFLANATVLLPSPSLLIAASCALILNPWAVALTAALGSSLCELVGYAFGTSGRDLSPKFGRILDKIAQKVTNPSLMVFVLALLPLPLFDFAGIYSGGTRMNLGRFLLLCFAGKFLKILIYTRLYDILDWITSISPQ